MDETEEPPPTEVGLEKVLDTIEPLLRKDQTPYDQQGNLYILKKDEPYNRDLNSPPEIVSAAPELEKVTEFYFFHEYEREGRFAPRLHEIVKNLPEHIDREKKAYIEVVFDMNEITRINGHYRGKAILYREAEHSEDAEEYHALS